MGDAVSALCGQCLGGKLLLIGLALGTLGAWAVSRGMESALYGVGTLDPSVLALSAGVLFLVVFFASLLPALRAAAIDPAITLRSE